MEAIEIRVLRLAHGEGLELPRPASVGSAGADVRAAVEEPRTIPPGGRTLIPTGLRLEIPTGWEIQVRPRSGLALKHGITVLNSPGTIDSDYRGEVGVVLINLGSEPFVVLRGQRIAQFVLAPTSRVRFRDRKDLSPSHRGEGGFGSSGLA